MLHFGRARDARAADARGLCMRGDDEPRAPRRCSERQGGEDRAEPRPDSGSWRRRPLVPVRGRRCHCMYQLPPSRQCPRRRLARQLLAARDWQQPVSHRVFQAWQPNLGRSSRRTHGCCCVEGMTRGRTRPLRPYPPPPAVKRLEHSAHQTSQRGGSHPRSFGGSYQRRHPRPRADFA